MNINLYAKPNNYSTLNQLANTYRKWPIKINIFKLICKIIVYHLTEYFYKAGDTRTKNLHKFSSKF